MKDKKIISQWEEAALEYSREQRYSANNSTDKQIIEESLGDIRGKVILDAGCGDGSFACKLYKQGAKVFACDASKAFIDIAKSEFPNIEYSVADLTEKLPYADSSFDIIVSALTLMDIEDIDNFFIEARRLLKDRGRVVFSIMHPCFFPAPWEKSATGERLYKKVDNYYAIYPTKLHYWGDTMHFHRPISYYSKVISDHGFLIERITENPSDLDILDSVKPHQKRVPLFMCFSLVKASA